jgi:predicted acyltransferase (DUF342 family)
MSSSWKQYGGISKLDKLNTINAGTVIADQFVSRSARPTYQYFNGTFEVSFDFISGRHVLLNDSIYAGGNITSNGFIYNNNKLFFGGDSSINYTYDNRKEYPVLPIQTDHAFMYGNSDNIGVNVIDPTASFNINGTTNAATDILTVESKNDYIRNIIAQNVNQRGIVIDADDTSSNIFFYTNDVSTNATNIPSASITSTNSGILSNSTHLQSTVTDGNLLFNTDGMDITTKGNVIISNEGHVHTDISLGYLLNASGGSFKIDDVAGNIEFDASNNFSIDCSGTEMLLENANSYLKTTSDFTLLSKGVDDNTTGTIILDSSSGNINLFSRTINATSTQRGISNESIHNETLAVYDNSNQIFLKNVYNDDTILTGNAATFIGVDLSSNTFINFNPAANKLGGAIGGGMAPYDPLRAITMFGTTNADGVYTPSQNIVSSTNTDKYLSTIGINTHKPRTEEYILDINGPTRIGNGEIHTKAECNFEINQCSFSKVNNNYYGIAIGSPSTATSDNNSSIASYSQQIVYKTANEQSWKISNVFDNNNTPDDFSIVFNDIYMYDENYAIVIGNNTTDTLNNPYAFATNDGGVTWYRILIHVPFNQRIFKKVSINQLSNNYRIIIQYSTFDNNSFGVYYFDTPTLEHLFTSDNTINYIINITTITDNNGGIHTNSISVINEQNIMVGNGISVFNTDSLTFNNPVNTNYTYYDIYCYNVNECIAVGDNIISYTIDGGSNWSNISNTNIIDSNNESPFIKLLSVYIYDSFNAVSVSADGKFLYSTAWKDGIWNIVNDNILNSSGIKDILIGSNNNLRNIFMNDINTFIIVNVITNYYDDPNDNSNDILGYSKILQCFLPNIFNRKNNNVADVSGNMIISGDIKVYDEGELLVNTIDKLDQYTNDNRNTIDIGRKTNTVNIGNNLINIGVETAKQVNIDASNITLSSVENMKITDGMALLQLDGNGYTTLYGATVFDLSCTDNIIMNTSSGTSINIGNVSNNLSNVHVNIGNTDASAVTLDASYISMTSLNHTDLSASTVVITGDVSMNNRLFVNDDVSLNSRLYVHGDSSFNGNVDVQGTIRATILNDNYVVNTRVTNYEVVITEDLSLSGSLFMDGSLNVVSDASLNSRLFVLDDVSFNSKFYVAKHAKVDGSLNVVGDVDINDRLFITNDASFSSKLYVDNDISTNANLYVTKHAKVDGSLNVVGDIAIDTRLFVTNDVSLSSKLYVDNDISTNANLYVTKHAKVDGSLNVVGDVAIDDRLFITNDVSFGSKLYVDNDISTNSNLYVTKHAQIDGSLNVVSDVSFNNRLFVTGNVYAGNMEAINKITTPVMLVTEELSVQGTINTINRDDLAVSSKTIALNFGSPFDVSGVGFMFYEENTVNGTTTADPSAGYIVIDNSRDKFAVKLPNLNNGTQHYLAIKDYNDDLSANNLFINKDISVKNRLFVIDDISFSNKLYVDNDISTNANLYVAKHAKVDGSLNVVGDADIDTRLFVTGDVSFSSKLYVDNDILTNANLYVTKHAKVDGSLNVVGDADIDTRLFVSNDVSFSSKLYVTKHAKVDGSLNIVGDIAIDNRLFVSNDASFSSKLYVDNDISTNANLYVSKHAKVDGSLNVVGDAAIDTRLFVTGDVSFNSKLYVDNDISTNANLYVTKHTKVDGSLNVVGDAAIDTRLFVTGDVSFNSKLYVDNDISTNSNLYVSKHAQVDGSLNVVGDVLFNNRLFVTEDVSFTQNLNMGGNIDLPNYDSRVNFKDGVSLKLDEWSNGTGDRLRILNGHLQMDSGKKLWFRNSNTDIGCLNNNSNDLDVYAKSKINLIGNETGIAFFTDTDNTGSNERMRIGVNGDISMIHNLYVADDVSLGSRLFVTEDVSFNEKLYVKEHTKVDGSLNVVGDVAINNRLFVTDDVSFNNDFYVHGDSSFNGDVDIIGVLRATDMTNNYVVNTHTTNYEFVVTTDMSMSGQLYVDGSMNVSEDVSLNKRLFVTGDATFKEDIFVSNTINGIKIWQGPGDGIVNNLSIGTNALSQNYYNQTNKGEYNTVYGNDSMVDNTFGKFNTSTGYKTLHENIDGNHNTANGYQSLYTNTTGDGNTAIGSGALEFNSTAGDNTAVGLAALNKTLGKQNTAIGSGAGEKNTDGSYNTFIGCGADIDTLNNVYEYSTAIGYESTITASNQIMIGRTTEMAVIPGNLHVIGDISYDGKLFLLGDASMHNNLYVGKHTRIDGSLNVIGDVDIDTRLFVSGDVSFSNKLYVDNDISTNANLYVTKHTQVDGSLNVVGDVAIDDRLFVTNDISTNANLYVTKHAQVDGSLNVMGDADIDTRLFVSGDVSFSNKLYVADDISTNANLYVTEHAQVDGSLNVVGDAAIDSRLFVTGDVSFSNKLYVDNDISTNTNLYVTKHAQVDGSLNVVGDVAIDDRLFVTNDATINTLTVGTGGGNQSSNAVFGLNALTSNSTGNWNTAIGREALKTNNDGSYNVAIGTDSLYNNSGGSSNVAVGNFALRLNSTGDSNTGIGYNALRNSTGSGNTAVGYGAGEVSGVGTCLYNTYLGYNADSQSNDLSNSTAIGYNSTITKSDQIVLGKTTSPPEVYIPGDLGIGTTSPLTALDVSGAGAIGIPCGNDDTDRPTGANLRLGQLRYNTISHSFEGYQGESGSEEWAELGGGGAFTVDGTEAVYDAGNIRLDGDIDTTGIQETNNQFVFSGIDTQNSNTRHELGAINVFHEANFNGDVTPHQMNATGNPGGLLFKTKNANGTLTTKMWIDGSGRTRIGNATSTDAIMNSHGEHFFVDGSSFLNGYTGIGPHANNATNSATLCRVYGRITATGFDATSDSRLKSNILPVTNGLTVINKLQGCTYTWKSDESNELQSGLIAQEVEDVIPHIVNTSDKENDLGFKQKTIDYNGIIPYLIESIKTLSNENNLLNEKINCLETDNANVKTDLSTCEHKLEKQNELIEKILKKLEL